MVRDVPRRRRVFPVASCMSCIPNKATKSHSSNDAVLRFSLQLVCLLNCGSADSEAAGSSSLLRRAASCSESLRKTSAKHVKSRDDDDDDDISATAASGGSTAAPRSAFVNTKITESDDGYSGSRPSVIKVVLIEVTPARGDRLRSSKSSCTTERAEKAAKKREDRRVCFLY